MPEDGYTECSIEPATAKQICFSTCNRDGYVQEHLSSPSLLKMYFPDSSSQIRTGRMLLAFQTIRCTLALIQLKLMALRTKARRN